MWGAEVVPRFGVPFVLLVSFVVELGQGRREFR